MKLHIRIARTKPFSPAGEMNLIRTSKIRRWIPGRVISPRVAKHRSNPWREDFDARLERAQGKHGTDRRSAEFPDIHGKSPLPYPSLVRDNFAGLHRSVRASALTVRIVLLLQTLIQRPA